MSERAEQLADRLDKELSRMIDFVGGLSESQLDAACQDPQGATVRHVLAHLREGTDQVVAWAAGVSDQPGGSAPANNHAHTHPAHDDGHDHDHSRVHGHPHTHDHSAEAHDPGAADVDRTVGQLRDGGGVIVAAVRGLTDQQLDVVPPPSEGLADGATPLHGIVTFIADDVAGHLGHLTAAVAAARTPHD